MGFRTVIIKNRAKLEVRLNSLIVRGEQVGLLLLESEKRRNLLSCEKAIIITEDLCEILENYKEI